jgi:hypothetical protein
MKINCVETDENLCHIKKKSDGKEFLKATTVHSFENICEKKDNWLIGEQSAHTTNPDMFLNYSIFILKM